MRKLAEKPSIVAIIALGLSVLTAVFTFFQWSTSQAELKINAAIELSKRYAEDKKLEVGLSQLLDAESVVDPAKIPFGEEARPIRDFVLHMEYAATLINHGRIDEKYLSPNLRCDFKVANRALQRISTEHRIHFQLPELSQFAGRISENCRGLERAPNLK